MKKLICAALGSATVALVLGIFLMLAQLNEITGAAVTPVVDDGVTCYVYRTSISCVPQDKLHK